MEVDKDNPPFIKTPYYDEDEESGRAAAYARILARLPKYASRAIEIARPLAYAFQIGESVKSTYPKLVKPLYGLSIGYIIGDIGVKSYLVKHKNSKYRALYSLDLSLWHLFASIILPSILIKSYVKITTKGLVKANLGNKMITYLPAISAICLIPFIVQPMDEFTHWAMDHSFRKYIDYTNYDDDFVLI